MKRTAILFVLFISIVGLAVAKSSDSLTDEPPISSICIEADSGMIIIEENADIERPPASMLKLIVMLLVAEGIENGKWTLDTPITATALAEGMGGTQVYLKAGETHPLGDLMKAIAVASANDAAVAVAEGLWGSDTACLEAMNTRARELGMAHTQFHSVNGLPPDPGQPSDLTTARDMALLGQTCVRNPQLMEWVGTKEYAFRPGTTEKTNTNKLLVRMDDCDGLKTGFTRAAGFCLTATAKRDGIRLIAVVMGDQSNFDRFNTAQQILENGFSSVTRVQYLAKGQRVAPAVRVYNCANNEINLAAAEDVWITVKQDDKSTLKVVAQLPQYLRAPAEHGAVVGEAEVKLQGQTIATVPLMVPEDLEVPSLRWKLEQSLRRTR